MTDQFVDIHKLPIGTVVRVFFPNPVRAEDGDLRQPYWGRWLRGRLLWEGSEHSKVRSLSLIEDPIFNSGDPALDVVGIYQEQIDNGDCQVEVE